MIVFLEDQQKQLVEDIIKWYAHFFKEVLSKDTNYQKELVDFGINHAGMLHALLFKIEDMENKPIKENKKQYIN